MSSVGDVIFDPRWDFVELGSGDQAISFELSKLASECCWRDRTHPVGELVETSLAVATETVEDSDLPATTDHAGESS